MTFDPYKKQQFKRSLQTLDKSIHQDSWRLNESLISRADRAKWLLRCAWKNTAVLVAVFFLILLTFIIAECVYKAISFYDGFPSGFRFYTINAYYSTINGGATTAIASGATPIIMFLIYAAQIKRIGFFVLTDKSMTGSFGSTKESTHLGLIIGAVLSAGLCALALLMTDGSQLISWWQAAVAGAIIGILIETSLERVADAVNVARTDTIAREATGEDGPRRYL